MHNKTQSQTFAEAFEFVRSLTKFYVSNLKDEDIHKRFELNGIKLNSAYWMTAHLVWTEHDLIMRGVGNKSLDIPWLDEYGFGSNPDEVKTKPDFKEVSAKLDEVHAEAMKILNALPDEELDKPNHINASFGGKNTKRAIIKHVIRHEPMHVGQISWILKLCGVKMV